MLSGMLTSMQRPCKLLSTIRRHCNDILVKWTSLPHHLFTLTFSVSFFEQYIERAHLSFNQQPRALLIKMTSTQKLKLKYA